MNKCELLINQIENDAKLRLKAELESMNEDLLLNVYRSTIIISPIIDGEIPFGCSIELNINSESKSMKINYGTCGSFDINNKGQYWKALIIASILKKWDEVNRIAIGACEEYNNVIDSI